VIRRATILAVGGLRGWADEGCQEYLKRLRGYFRVEIVEVREEDVNRRSADEVLAAEGGRLLQRLPQGAYVITLDREKGKALSSEELSQRLSSLGISSQSHVAFVLGGSLGLSKEVLKKADATVSFGNLTLPHSLARVVLLEQIYRAVKINRGEKYHW